MQNGILEVGWSFNAPSWYISVLLCCYVVYFLVTWHPEPSKGIGILEYGALTLVGGILIVLNWNYPLVNPLIGRGFCCFFVGVLVYTVYEAKDVLYTSRIGYLCLSFLIVTGILVTAFWYSVLGNRHMAVALGIAPALVLTVLFVPWINQILAIKPLVYLGKISMSIYLLHFPIQCVWKIFEVYTGIEINYSRRSVWIAYAVSVLIAAALYERFGADKVRRMGCLAVRNEL